jgi:hypothetical protein
MISFDVLQLEDASIGILTGMQAVERVKYKDGKPDHIQDHTGLPESSKPVVDQQATQGYGNVSPWGIDNLYPQWVYKNTRHNSIIPSTINRQVELLLGAGWQVGIFEYDDDGEEHFIPRKNDRLIKFLERMNFNGYLTETAVDWYWFFNAFPEVVVDYDRQSIVTCRRQKSMFCRWSRQDDWGRVSKCYINANWQLAQSETHPLTLTREVVDRYYDPIAHLKMAKGTHFIYPLSFPSPGETFYQAAAWHSAIHSHWVELSNSIPEFKKFLMKNQMTVKYVVTIANEYWTAKYQHKWESMTDEDKNTKIEDLKEKIRVYLQGNKNAGKALFFPGFIDVVGGKDIKKYIEIEELPNKTLSGEYLPESHEAASHLLYALGVPYTLLGNSVGSSKLGSGSGSDVFEHLRMYLLRVSLHANIILEPFNRLILPYNGFEEKIQLRKPAMQRKAQISPADRDVNETE